MRRARQRDVAAQAPWQLTGAELQAKTAGQFTDAPALYVFQLQNRQPLLLGQTAFAIQRTLGVGQRNHLAAQVHDLARRVLRNVAGTGDCHSLALDCQTAALEHFFGEVHATETGGFRANQAAAVAWAFAGHHAGELVAQALVLAEQETDLPRADTDVPGRHVNVGTDVAVQLAHEGLAEAHDFRVAFAFGVKVRTTLAAAHGQ
ncbi:hypothetical protein D3C72_1657550 [compost metagenome]